MGHTEKTIRPETALFVEALRAILQAEENTLSGFSLIYGETIPKEGDKTSGEEMYHKSGLPSLFEDTKNLLETLIGHTFELEIAGLLGE